MTARARTAGGSPLVAGPVIGWRTWSLSGVGDDLRLRPVTGRRRPWPRRAPARAMCGKRHFHRAPDVDCTCGLHATREPGLLQRTKGPAVIGLVALWGTVVEHELGFRARFAYPTAIRLICPICFWQRGLDDSRDPILVALFPRARPMPLCPRHLARAGDAGLRPSSVVPASAALRTLVDSYGIDGLSLSPARSAGH